MSEVVPAFLGTLRTAILEELASGTSRDVPSSPTCSCDSQDWDSRGANLRDVRVVPAFLGTVRG